MNKHYYIGKRKQSVRKAVKLHTVNVLEVTDENGADGVRSFADTQEGNKQAERLFRRCMKENGADMSRHSVDAALDMGIWSDGHGYNLYLTHSY